MVQKFSTILTQPYSLQGVAIHTHSASVWRRMWRRQLSYKDNAPCGRAPLRARSVPFLMPCKDHRPTTAPSELLQKWSGANAMQRKDRLTTTAPSSLLQKCCVATTFKPAHGTVLSSLMPTLPATKRPPIHDPGASPRLSSRVVPRVVDHNRGGRPQSHLQRTVTSQWVLVDDRMFMDELDRTEIGCWSGSDAIRLDHVLLVARMAGSFLFLPAMLLCHACSTRRTAKSAASPAL